MKICILFVGYFPRLVLVNNLPVSPPTRGASSIYESSSGIAYQMHHNSAENEEEIKVLYCLALKNEEEIRKRSLKRRLLICLFVLSPNIRQKLYLTKKMSDTLAE